MEKNDVFSLDTALAENNTTTIELNDIVQRSVDSLVSDMDLDRIIKICEHPNSTDETRLLLFNQMDRAVNLKRLVAHYFAEPETTGNLIGIESDLFVRAILLTNPNFVELSNDSAMKLLTSAEMGSGGALYSPIVLLRAVEEGRALRLNGKMIDFEKIYRDEAEKLSVEE